MELVEVKKNEVFCDSILVAKKFGKQHAEVVRLIKNLEKGLAKLRVISNHPKTVIEEREYRNQKYTSYLMNRKFFSLLVMRFKGQKALEWQVKFNDAFYEMEKRLILANTNATDPKFFHAREQVKIGRKEETDVIKDFVQYATNQGSTKSMFYYKHITNATYQALDLMCQRKPKLRESMNIYELGELLLMERFVRIKLKHYMSLQRNYRDIYECVKCDMIEYGKNITIKYVVTNNLLD
jgi:Rha family phage regulatory protein